MPDGGLRPPELVLKVAGISVCLGISDPGLYRASKHRYLAFLDTGPSATPVHIEVQIIPGSAASPPSSLALPEVVFADDRVSMVTPLGDGFFDLTQMNGRLRCRPVYLIETLDYYLRVVYALLAYRAGGLLFHAAGIVRGGQAFLFFGPSGSGKTTISRASADYRVLNDDLLVLLPENDAWVAHSTPFWNPTQVKPEPACAPLTALFWLVQDQKVHLAALGQAQAVGQLISNVPVLAGQPALLPELLRRCAEISRSLPVFALHFLPDGSFWQAIELAGLLAIG